MQDFLGYGRQVFPGYLKLPKPVGHPHSQDKVVDRPGGGFGGSLVAHASSVYAGRPGQESLFGGGNRPVVLHDVRLSYARCVTMAHGVPDTNNVSDGVAKPGIEIGRAHHGHPCRHQTPKPGVQVIMRLAGPSQVVKQHLGRRQYWSVYGRLVPRGVKPLDAVV